ncbi:fatty-acyl-CoA synthase [Thermomonospora echinospora]|uniref:Fatty-acyl-CoA synthase n=1 Tax=Thermomonospora echinospora TaxID=1992 RepID=A0A1H5VBR9_9ACTN|nr:AMP-binding protein [Thermomonospora echinospora]SEF84802.1 fatty-acyl-CoA synthase [Thermomonospora echinospora]
MLDRVRAWAGTAREAARAVHGAGMLTPVRPDLAVRMPLRYRRFGPTPATLGAIAALRWPDRTALIDERGEITYAELDRQAAALATALHERRPPGSAIGVLCRNHRGFVQALLAASRLGADVVLLNTDFSARQLGDVLDREHVGLLVHDAEFDEVVGGSSFTGARVLADGIAGPVSAAAPPPPHGRCRVIVLTSGTTGTPKGARTEPSLPLLLRSSFSHLMRVPLRSGEPIIVAPPLFHVLGLGYLSLAMSLGMPVVPTRRFDPDEVLAAVERHRVQALVAVPIMLQRLTEAASRTRHDTGSLRVVVSGGSALLPRVAEAFMDRFGDVLVNIYGATETMWAAIATPADLREAPGTVGRPVAGLKVAILDPDGAAALPPGRTGEIYTSGGVHFTGYTGGGDRPRRGGLIGTGDLGHLDAAGRLFVDGRADDMIVSGGENVFPGEVEDVLTGHPDVAEAAVTGVDDPEFGQRLAAYVVPGKGSGLTADDVRDHVRRNLARYKVPRDVHLVAELPRTITGKVRKRDLAHRDV